MRTQIVFNLNEMIQPLELLGDLFDALSLFEVDRINGKPLWLTYHLVQKFVEELDRYMDSYYQEWDKQDLNNWTGEMYSKWSDSFRDNYYLANPQLPELEARVMEILPIIQNCWLEYPGLRMIFGYDASTLFDTVSRRYPYATRYPTSLYQMSRNEDLRDLPNVLKKLAILQQDFYEDFNWRLNRSRIQVQELSERFNGGEITPELLVETEQVLFNLKYALKAIFNS